MDFRRKQAEESKRRFEVQTNLQRQQLALARQKAGRAKEPKDAIIRLNNRAERLRGLIAQGNLDPEVRAQLGRRLKNVESRIAKITTVTGRTAEDVAATTGTRERTKAQVKGEVAEKARLKGLDRVIGALDTAIGSVEKGVGPGPYLVEKAQGLIDTLRRYSGIDFQGPEGRKASGELIKARQRIKVAREQFLKWAKTTGRVAIQEQQRILEMFRVLGVTDSPETARDTLGELKKSLEAMKGKTGGVTKYRIIDGKLVPQ